MVPSSKYNVDTTVDYGGGAVISLTKTVRNNLYTLNQDTDLSICYSNYKTDALTHIDQNISPYNTDTDTSASYGTITEASYSRTLKDWVRSAPANKIYAGFALYYDTDGTDRSNFWGYRGGASSVSGDANGRFLHDIDYNKLVFPIGTITVRDKSVYDNIDYDTYPEVWYGAAYAPSDHNITLSQLDANPSDYYVSDFSFNNAFIYRPNNNDWVSTSIRPVLFISGDSAGGVSAYKNPFLGFYNSNLGMTTTNPNNNPSAGGGGESPKVYNKLSTGYSLGFTNNFAIRQTKFANIQDAFAWGKAKYQSIYGTASGTHNFYFEHQEIDLGDTVMCIQWYIEIKYVGWWVPPYVNCNYQIRLKGDFVNRYLAGTGLYWSIDGTMPTGLTPTTLHTSNKIWLGAMNEDGTTSGTWVKGADIYTYSGYNKIGNTANPNYDPSKSGDDNPWDVDPETYGWSGGEVSGMVKYYLLTAGQMDSLQTAIASNANWTIDYLNCVVSCFVVPNSGIFFDAPIPTTVKFVLDNATQWDTGVACSRIQGTINKSGGTIEIPRLTNTFYDFEPYSDYSVYIPFCGRVPIKGNVCLGREIKVTYYPDVPTCLLTAVISCDGATIAIAKGSFGTMTPITSNGSDRKTAAVIGEVAPIITGIGTGIVGVALGNPLIVGAGAAQALGGIMGGVKETVQSYAYSVGSTGDSSFFSAGNRCFYYANYPIIDEVVNNSMFGHSVGYLCNTVGKLSGFTGFTICANPHVTFSASAEEREEIERLLSMGVIL